MSIVGQRSNRSERISRFADSSDDEDDEEERLLSEAHGEASEAPTSNKRGLKEEDIEAEYSKMKPKKPRVVLTESDLTGMKGLIRIPTEFSRLQFNTKSKSKVDAAALYAKQLCQKYKSFCYDLFPGMAMEDVLARMEAFGSRKSVKSYLNTMREEARNKHLEAVVGKETAERWIQELQEGMAQSEVSIEDEEPCTSVELPRTTRSVVSEPLGQELRSSRTPTTKTANTTSSRLVDTDDEDEAMFNDVVLTKRKVILDDSDDDEAMAAENNSDGMFTSHEQADTSQASDGEAVQATKEIEETVEEFQEEGKMETSKVAEFRSMATAASDDEVEMDFGESSVHEEAKTEISLSGPTNSYIEQADVSQPTESSSEILIQLGTETQATATSQDFPLTMESNAQSLLATGHSIVRSKMQARLDDSDVDEPVKVGDKFGFEEATLTINLKQSDVAHITHDETGEKKNGHEVQVVLRNDNNEIEKEATFDRRPTETSDDVMCMQLEVTEVDEKPNKESWLSSPTDSVVEKADVSQPSESSQEIPTQLESETQVKFTCQDLTSDSVIEKADVSQPSESIQEIPTQLEPETQVKFT